jgi:quercetin dioxygenase-like cupin family protein
MTYHGDGEVGAVYTMRDEAEQLMIRPTTTASFIASGSLTRGRFGLFRWDMSAGAGGAGAHFHRTFAESFFILSGTVALYNGAAWVDASAGDFLYVPEGSVHGFSNDSNDPASMLILFAPGGARENYFKEIAEIASSGRRPSDEEWTELYARHDQYMV